MEITELLNDALMYPLQNVKALVVYAVLGIILGISIAGTMAGIVAGVNANNFFALFGSGILGIIVALFIGFVITGYQLDIIKYGIQKNYDAPEIDLKRQFINGVKFLVVVFIYMIIPILISAILALIFQQWIVIIVTVILSILFSLALLMAECRLAKTEELSHALAIQEPVADIPKVGIVNIVVLVVIIAIMNLIVSFIGGSISQWNVIVGGLIQGILGIYLVFFTGRATGLLYSEI